MSVIEGGILLLVMVALYAFAAVFFLAMTYSPNPRVWANCRRRWENGKFVLSDRIAWFAIPFGLGFAAVGVFGGIAMVNTFVLADRGPQWIVFPPLFLIAGIVPTWFGLSMAFGRSRLTIDRPADKLFLTGYLGPLRLRRRSFQLSVFNAVHLKIERRGRFGGRRWVIYLLGGPRELEVCGGDELEAHQVSQEIAKTIDLPLRIVPT